MISITLNALDLDSPDGYSKTIHVSTKAEARKAYDEFCNSTPFARWYSDHISHDLDDNEINEWLSL